MESDNTIYLNYRFDSSRLVLPDLRPYFTNHKLKISFSGDPCSDDDIVIAYISKEGKVVQENDIHLISNLVDYLREDLMNEQSYSCRGGVSYKTSNQGNDDIIAITCYDAM